MKSQVRGNLSRLKGSLWWRQVPGGGAVIGKGEVDRHGEIFVISKEESRVRGRLGVRLDSEVFAVSKEVFYLCCEEIEVHFISWQGQGRAVLDEPGDVLLATGSNLLNVVLVGSRRVLDGVLVAQKLWAVVASVHWCGGWAEGSSSKNNPTAAIVYEC
jgi:hypothetical protein